VSNIIEAAGTTKICNSIEALDRGLLDRAYFRGFIASTSRGRPAVLGTIQVLSTRAVE
jgi:hypothetical protein